ncbi:MAG TPA: bifunctional nuclease domain-containing protein [Anaerolineales bacterium]|nr:bifunctional nuclease domain-containing protein [Anaerolineales bacterium]
MVERTDRELVILARQGDTEAFGCLIERYQALARRITLRMILAEEAAQDLVQEAMLQAYLSLKDLRNEDSFRSWLYGIVLNVSKSYLREEKRRSRFSEALHDDQPEGRWNSSGATQDPQQIAMERELHSLVLSAIEELPAASREAARLHYYESLTLHEIAAISGAAPGAIKVRLHRARKYLREKLHQAYPEIKPGTTPLYRRKIMIKANVVDIVKRDENYVVLLQDEAQGKILPMWIGPIEGTAIAMGLRAYPTVRPMTFDFMIHLLDALGAQLEEVRVEVLKDSIFYGIAKVRIGNEEKEVDARPSDVLALAVRTNSPIYVAEEVMQQASQDLAEYEKESGKLTPGEGVEAILKEFESSLKEFAKRQFQTPSQSEEGDMEPPKD